VSHFFSFVFWRWGETDDETQFNYIEGSGIGPEDWGKLDPPNWIACGNGTMQSPIDIQQVPGSQTLGELETDYESANATLVNSGHDIAVIKLLLQFTLYFVILFL
jgi:carbonic anhydrase